MTCEISSWEIHSPYLKIVWSDQSTSDFHLFWLRENSLDENSRDKNSGQKLKPFLAIPAESQAVEISLDPRGNLVVQWSDGKTVSSYTPNWLRANASASLHAQRLAEAPKLWCGEEGRQVAVVDYERLLRDEKLEHASLGQFLKYGFLHLCNVPCRENEVAIVAERFGYVRETNYGRIFDVKALIDPDHPAYSNIELAPHTDTNYRFSNPSIQLLHCLSNSVDGGESTLVDGFYVAEKLRREDPKAFQILVSTMVPFFYNDEKTALFNEQAIIRLQGNGGLAEVHFNERTMAPLRIAPEAMSDFYAAYRKFSEMMHDKSCEFQYKMQPGELVIFNNIRLLHGRKAFQGKAGARHLQGCYSDIDAYISRYRVLGRKTGL